MGHSVPSEVRFQVRHLDGQQRTPFNRKLALVGIIPIKFSSLSAPTKIEELTAGSDEKTQRSPAGNRTQGLANSSRTL